MAKEIVPLPDRRLRCVSQERLIDRPLRHQRLGLTPLRCRRRAGLLIWLAACFVVVALYLAGRHQRRRPRELVPSENAGGCRVTRGMQCRLFSRLMRPNACGARSEAAQVGLPSGVAQRPPRHLFNSFSLRLVDNYASPFVLRET